MEIASLQAEPREAAGTRAARRLRRDGKLPGIVYGHGQTPEPIAVNAHDLEQLLEHGAHVLELDLPDKKQQVLIKEVQHDHLSATPVHVDFALVDTDERVAVGVPIEFKGEPVGTHEGGLLEHNLVDIEVECRVVEIPDSIRVDVSHLNVGDSLHAGEVKLPDGVTLVTPEETIVCAVRVKKTAPVAEEAEVEGEEGEGQEPEIVSRKTKEEEEAEGEG